MKRLQQLAGLAGETWAALRKAFGGRGRSRPRAVADRDGLRTFLETRASYVAQMSLYGYLRTRAGVRFPELFMDDPFVVSINIAKWHIWLACLSDISVYAGFLMLRGSNGSVADIGKLMRATLDDALAVAGIPEDAGPEFTAHADRVRTRLALCDWTTLKDDEFAFTESPAALVQWAPIVDDLKQLDAEVVRNSVRFRWQEVRRDLRRDLRAEAVLAEANAGSVDAVAAPMPPTA